MSLRDYEQGKFTIAEALRAGRRAVPPDLSAWHDQAQQLLARLAEDRFNLVMIGGFNRGKTSLMNAIMGLDRLPTAIVPLTSVITTVTYGSRDRAILNFENSRLTREIALDELPPYVTQDGNPGNERRIGTVEVRLPAEILRRGFYFVDTPGLGSAIAENTRTTEAFLPQADAFVLVTSYESPLSEDEIGFLRLASATPKRVFVVVNKQDLLQDEPDSQDQRTALRYIGEQLGQIGDTKSVRVFSVSAREGLKAKQAKDESCLMASGLPALEEALISFLLEEKSTAFLLAMCDRAATLLREPPCESTALAKDVIQLAQRIAESSETEGLWAPAKSSLTCANAIEVAPQAGHGACEICTAVDQALWAYLRRFQYEISVDRGLQQSFAEAGGLCGFHAWKYETIASPLSTCIGFPPLLERDAAKLRAWTEKPSLAPDKQAAFDHRTANEAVEADVGPDCAAPNCPMCAVQAEAEGNALSALAERLNRTLAAADPPAPHLCLPHLARLIPMLADQDRARTLAEDQAARLMRLSEDMQRYALKRDAVRRQLLTEEEKQAAHRALLLLAGHRTVKDCVPPARADHRAGDPATDCAETLAALANAERP